ncbi:MAG: hypothetical protein FJX23_06540 [Alphaproteobacteria bacterium]|nr:hypothetical protein [Alphaproteobacteria bacterium]
MKKQHLLLIAAIILVLIAANVALKPKTVPEEEAVPAAVTQTTPAQTDATAPVAVEPKAYDPKDYDYSALWADPIRSRLLAFLGAETYANLQANLEVVTPITEEGDWRIFKGIRAHNGGTEEALLWMNQKNDDILLILIHNSTLQVYFPDHLKRSTLPPAFISAIVDMNYNKYSEIMNAVDTSVVRATEELPEGALTEGDDHEGHDH